VIWGTGAVLPALADTVKVTGIGLGGETTVVGGIVNPSDLSGNAISRVTRPSGAGAEIEAAVHRTISTLRRIKGSPGWPVGPPGTMMPL
jgi:hypothetical protein